jgi:penicillin-binding protein-related factor A (putative recombinase)
LVGAEVAAVKSKCEAAMRLAEKSYRKQGHCYIEDRPTPTFTRRNGSRGYLGKAPIDFRGVVHGGKAYAREAKDTSELSFPLAQLREDQRDALAQVYALGADVGVVILFVKAGEAYDLPWWRLAAFLESPWRQSVTIEMCRAWGLQLPYDGQRIRFLDGRAHPLISDAVGNVAREEVQARIAAAQSPLFEVSTPKKRVKPEPPRTADGKLDLIGGMKWGAKARGIK